MVGTLDFLWVFPKYIFVLPKELEKKEEEKYVPKVKAGAQAE